MSDNPSGLILFLGRLHPVLVHLPIGFILLLAALEALALSPRFKNAASASRVIVVLSVPAVLCSAGCGWLLSWSGSYDEQTLAWHKWLGTALAPTIVVLAVLHWRGRMKSYRVCLFATVALLVVTGHFGGSLTHGRDYLLVFRKAPAQELAPSLLSQDGTPNDPASQPVFATVIQPLFDEYCISCHGPEKSKAKLRLDTAEYVFKGSSSGPVIEPGNVSQSYLLKRLLLPEGDDDHMPPSGKRQPTAAEIALLKWWIDVGAPVNKTVEELKMPEVQ